MTLPAGMAISLSAANGLGACAPGEAEACPESSKLGEAEVVTPLLEQPLKGAVYLAQQETLEESLVGLYVVVEGGGVLVKLAGRATLDPNTGQVTIAFENLPQLPLSEIGLSLFGGPRAALVTPPRLRDIHDDVAADAVERRRAGAALEPVHGRSELRSGL